MFDITSSKLMILAIIALLVVGPKDLPVLLRTVGKYLGMIRRQAYEFRAQLEEALRESEYDEIKKDFENVGREMQETLEEGGRAIDTQMAQARIGVDQALEEVADKPAYGADDARQLEPPPDAEPDSEAGPVSETEPVSEAEPERPEKTGT